MEVHSLDKEVDGNGIHDQTSAAVAFIPQQAIRKQKKIAIKKLTLLFLFLMAPFS
jgi:hypothetical protein